MNVLNKGIEGLPKLKKGKALIITGDKGTGKNSLAKLFLKNAIAPVLYSHQELKEYSSSWVNFPKCTKKTTLIIIDECSPSFVYDYFSTFIIRGIIIKRREKKAFMICPNFIFLTTSIPKIKDSHLFDVFNIRDNLDVVKRLLEID